MTDLWSSVRGSNVELDSRWSSAEPSGGRSDEPECRARIEKKLALLPPYRQVDVEQRVVDVVVVVRGREWYAHAPFSQENV